VKVGDKSKWQKNEGCGGQHSISQGESKAVDCEGKKGRYVSIVIPRKSTLHLCEVKIMVVPQKGVRRVKGCGLCGYARTQGRCCVDM